MYIQFTNTHWGCEGFKTEYTVILGIFRHAFGEPQLFDFVIQNKRQRDFQM